MLILGRNLHAENTVISSLSKIFGIEFNKFDEHKARESLQYIQDREVFNSELRKARKQWMKDVHGEAQSLIANSIGRGGFALIVGGIDEINSNYREEFEHDLAFIIQSCAALKVLATCRAGDWNRAVVTADIVTIEPLNERELQEIVNAWTDRPSEFFEQISSVPYREVLDRPLFLTLLLIIFNQGYSIPDFPIDVYDRVTSLLIERWDRERDIFRETKFSTFLSEKKLRFLSALAFELTFEYSEKRFSLTSFSRIYRLLAQRFNLPPDEFEAVLAEIESHTGIIVEAGFNTYEFCHLTVQEFLAAKHLVGLANLNNVLAHLDTSPATMAVATSVSADPSNFLAHVLDSLYKVQSPRINMGRTEGFNSFLTFISRIRLEIPEFSRSNPLALGVLRLWDMATRLHKIDPALGEQLLDAASALNEFDAIRESVCLVLERPGAISPYPDQEITLVKSMGLEFKISSHFLQNLSRD